MRCTARASPVGRVRRRANAFSLCGLSHCDDSPPLLCGTPRHSVFTACRIQARAMSGAHDIPLRVRDEFSSTRYERHGMAFRFHCMSNSSTRGAHNMATSCTRKEWATAVAADSEVCIGRLGRDAPILEEHISFSPQCRQSIMMVPARQR